MTIRVSEMAKAKLLGLGLDSQRFLRIDVIPGGCSGFTYDAVIDDVLDAEDFIVFESEPLRIVTASHSLPFMDGLSIDYSEDLVQSGFRFTNSNAVNTCGCGASFATEGAGCGTGCGS